MNGVWRTYFAEKPNCTVTYAQHECIICCCRSDGTIDVWASGSHAVVSRTVDHTVLSSNPPLPTGQTVLMQSSSTDLQSKTHNTVWVNSFVQCCFTSTETVPTIRDGEPRTPTSTFTRTIPELWVNSFRRHINDLTFSQAHAELRRCVKVEVDVLDFPSLTVLTISVDVKQH